MISPLVLGIETSGTPGGLALLEGNRVLIERSLSHAGNRRGSALLAELDKALREASRTLDECQLIAVNVGPGSFTGLRVGVVLAKTLAYALQRPVVGIDSPQILAAGFDPNDAADGSLSGERMLHVVIDAQRSEVFHQTFRLAPLSEHEEHNVLGHPAWRPATQIQILSPAKLTKFVQPGELVVGPAIDRYRTEFDLLGGRCPLHQREPSAAVAAYLGWTRFQTQGPDDLWSLSPAYGRLSSAEELRLKR